MNEPDNCAICKGFPVDMDIQMTYVQGKPIALLCKWHRMVLQCWINADGIELGIKKFCKAYNLVDF